MFCYNDNNINVPGPIGEDYEIEVDPAVSSMKISRVDNQRRQNPLTLTHPPSLAHHYPSSLETFLPRKRGRHEVLFPPNLKTRRLSPSTVPTTRAPATDSDDVVCVAQDVKVEVDVGVPTLNRAVLDRDNNDVQEIVDFSAEEENTHPLPRSHRSRSEDGNRKTIHRGRSRSNEVAVCEANFQRVPSSTRPQQQYSPFPPNESISEILEGPFPASEALEAKIAACEVYSNASLAPDTPDNDVAMKIIKRFGV